jgi:histidinol-phosphate phosphatase family protein
MLSTPSSAVTATAGDSRGSAVARALVEERAGRQWCLFLDRDGVINRRIDCDYVRNWRQFEWLPGALEALTILNRWAPYIVVVTNQQGIGKGLMTDHDVELIHRRMQDEAADSGREFDGIQLCPHLASADCECRKPRPGLVLDWLHRNPSCDPRLCVVVGDSLSDLQLGRLVG